MRKARFHVSTKLTFRGTTSICERWEDKFRPLKDISLHIEYTAVPFSQILARLKMIAEELGILVDEDILELPVDRSEGDLRSTLNDLEAVARGRERVTMADCDGLATRDRKDYTPDALMKLFSAKTLRDARRIVSSTYIDYDTLFDWIYENLPVVLDDPGDLAEGMDALARADVHQTRGKRTQEYRLLKYMFNDMTGGVAFSKVNSEGTGLLALVRSKEAELGFPPSGFTVTETLNGVRIKPTKYLGNDWRRVNTALGGIGARWVRGGGCWELPYFRPPQLVWRYRRTWGSRRRLRSVSKSVAAKCHVSSREAIAEVIPMMKVIYQDNPDMAEEISAWLELDEKEVKWLGS